MTTQKWTVEELRAVKEGLEEELRERISDALTRFAQETGLTVEAVDVGFTDVTVHGGGRKTALVGVKIRTARI